MLLAGIGAVLIPLALAAGPAHEPTPEVQKYLRAAMALYDSLEFERMLELLAEARKVAVGSSDDVAIGVLEGILDVELRKEADGRAAFERALLLDPDATLPITVSPKIRELFDATRDRVRARLAALPAAEPAPTPEPVAKPETIPPAPPPPGPLEVHESPSRGWGFPYAVAALGVGAAAGGVGAYLSADALRYNQNKTGLSWPQAQSARVSASHELIGGECLIAAGAAAVLAGAGLWFFGRPGAAVLAVTPAGISARGAF